MAAKFFCDLCDQETGSQTTRRWENIAGDLGLEVIVLRGSAPVVDTFICGDCITRMFWSACEKYRDNPINRLHDSLRDKQESYEKAEKDLNFKKIELDVGLEQLKKQKEEFDLKKIGLDARETKITAVEVTTAKWERAVAQAEARGYQRAVDEHEYPELIERVEANAFKRAGG